MESHKNISLKHAKLLRTLSRLPVQMLKAHHEEKLSELVLYELAHPNCFNFSKVAYIIDNPHFDCLQGITGFSNKEHPTESLEDPWTNAKPLHESMQNSSFNQKVRSIQQSGMGHTLAKEPKKLEALSRTLEFDNPAYYTWQIKHDNHGILLFEHQDPSSADHYDDELLQGLSLLGFCPVY